MVRARFRALGAGVPMVAMAERGAWYPDVVAVAIGLVLPGCAAYALAGSSVIGLLPWTRPVVGVIAAIYVARAVLFPPLKPLFYGSGNIFWRLSSGVCLLIGLLHAAGPRCAVT